MTTEIPRRTFLAGSIAATAACAAPAVTASAVTAADDPADSPSKQEFYEVRTYRCPAAEQQAGVLDYVSTALVPALERLGCGPVGVFTTVGPEGQAPPADVSLVITYPTLDLLGRRNDALQRDEAYLAAAAKHFAVPKDAPAYTRIESRLLKAFAGMPKIAVPPSASGAAVFELRIYESQNAEKAALKVAMFNEGEIDIMKNVGLGPVFFGEALISNDLPNLTYMLSGESPEAHTAHWDAFRKDPDWNRMKVIPRYAPTVSKITSITLRSAQGSQI